MSQIFNSKPSKGHKIGRNPFDLSFQTNGTFRFGRLYPVYCQRVAPGTGLTINPTLGLRSLPMAFPTQTRLFARIHFWYVRTRTLWRDFPDWVAMTDDVRTSQGGNKKNYEFPWIKLTNDDCKTGSLADWLGVPTTFATSNHLTQLFKPYAYFGSVDKNKVRNGVLNHSRSEGIPIHGTPLEITSRIPNCLPSTIFGNTSNPRQSSIYGCYLDNKLMGSLGSQSKVRINVNFDHEAGIADTAHLVIYTNDTFKVGITLGTATFTDRTADIPLRESTINLINNYYKESNGNVKFFFSLDTFSDATVMCTDANFKSLESVSFTDVNVPNVVDAVDAGITPFAGDTPSIKVSAMPFRAYESIYNFFYRNTQVNPALLKDTDDGTAYYEYNKFCCDYGGKDSNHYDFHNKNWEQDQFTTMHCSPQLGDAPLVSLSTNAEDLEHFKVNVKGINPIINKNAGDTPAQKDYVFEPIWNSEHTQINGFTCTSSDVPKDLSQIMRLAKCGITLNDLRNASALQSYLEARIRASFSYRDLMSDVYHIDELDYNNVMCPEFLGGTNDEININCITNTNGDASGGLGDYGANATCLSDNNRSINVFCPEEGYVIGILSLEPVATYSQLLRKDLTIPNSPLDWYTESMSDIGLQPVRAYELTPIQRASEIASNPSRSFDEVLGYQRPWYEYIRRNDEIHGDMRKDLAGFCITRIFDSTPKLNSKFIECRAEDITTPFYDGSIDGFLGMIYFNVGAKLPIKLTDSVHLL